MSALLVVVLPLAFFGCRTLDDALYDAEGRRLDELPLAPYRVAVLPFAKDRERADSESQQSELSLVFSERELQAELVDQLNRMNAATQVVSLDFDPDRYSNRNKRKNFNADLWLRPRVQEFPKLAFEKTLKARYWAGVWPTWLSFWFFPFLLDSFRIEDERYLAQMVVAFEVWDPAGSTVIDRFVALSDRADLSFLERNRRGSWRFWRILFPPVSFWKFHDDPKQVATVLSERICERLAARVTRYLKQDIQETVKEEYRPLIHFSEPDNGIELSREGVRVIGEINAEKKVEELSYRVNDGGRKRLPMSQVKLWNNTFRVRFDERIPAESFRSPDNFLTIEVNVSGLRTTSTLLVRRRGTEQKATDGLGGG